ncbi:MAG: hypothetical protein ACP5OC_02740 [Thermoplasmata archaeon]
MRLGMYVHPWDIADEGTRNVLSLLAKSGIEFINLAVSYHSGRFFLPHNPAKKVYYADEGVIYFDPGKDDFKSSKLKPFKSSSHAGRDILKESVDIAKDYGITVNAWTVCLHNGRFAVEYPDLAVENMYGEKDRNFLCPVKSDSTKYIKSMIMSLATGYDIGEIELESAFFPSAFIHGAHHEVMGIRITPVMSYLLSTCFCPDCIASARSKGIDLNLSRKHAISYIHDQVLSMRDISNPDEVAFPDLNQATIQAGFEDIISFKNAVSRDLLLEYSEAAIVAGTNISIVSTSRGLAGSGIDLKIPPGTIKALDLIAYYQNISEIKSDVSLIRTKVPSNIPVRTGINLTYPYAYNSARLHESVEAALSAGSNSIIFYNYGWATENIIEEIQNLRE